MFSHMYTQHKLYTDCGQLSDHWVKYDQPIYNTAPLRFKFSFSLIFEKYGVTQVCQSERSATGCVTQDK